MEFNKAIKDADNYFELNKITTDVYQIVTPYMINSYDAMYIVIKDIDGVGYLTDYGTIFERMNLTKEQVTLICNKHNISFNNYKIMCEYNGVDDVKNIIMCIDDIIGENNKNNK